LRCRHSALSAGSAPFDAVHGQLRDFHSALRWLGELAEEYALVRRSNIVLFKNLPEEAWERRGTANNFPVSVRGLAYVIVGHERHHLKVLREKYNV
jgi:hypothetical protein